MGARRSNRLQRWLAAAGLLAIAAAGLYCPWVFEFEEDIGYDDSYFVPVFTRSRAWIWSSHQPVSPWSDEGEYRFVGAQIDLQQLIPEWVVIAAFSGGLVLLAGGRRLPAGSDRPEDA